MLYKCTHLAKTGSRETIKTVCYKNRNIHICTEIITGWHYRIVIHLCSFWLARVIVKPKPTNSSNQVLKVKQSKEENTNIIYNIIHIMKNDLTYINIV